MILVRRQSPDWAGLSRDFRAGSPIDGSRFVPDHEIFGFPSHIETLVEQWNARFSMDFFSFRAAVADLSAACVNAIPGARSFALEDVERVVEIAAREDAYIYFHDDDDFFSPRLTSVVRGVGTQPDAIVTPLFRIGLPTFTFVREGHASVPVWGEVRRPDFRFQSNNYGISSRRCRSMSDLWALKDHVAASARADELGFEDAVLPTPLSATVKTPGSASMLPSVFASNASPEEVVLRYADQLRRLETPPGCAWIGRPIEEIGGLVGALVG